MVKRLLLVIAIASIIIPGYIYVYLRGFEDGIREYKRSWAMIKALESAYNFGLKDGLRWYY